MRKGENTLWHAVEDSNGSESTLEMSRTEELPEYNGNGP